MCAAMIFQMDIVCRRQKKDCNSFVARQKAKKKGTLLGFLFFMLSQPFFSFPAVF